MKKVAFIYLSNYIDWPLGGMLTYVNNIIPYLNTNPEWSMDIWGGEIVGTQNCNRNIKVYTKIKTLRKIIPNFVRSFFGILRNKRAFRDYEIVYSHTAATTLAMKLCYPRKFVIHHQHGLSYKNVKGYKKILNIGYTFAQLFANATFFVASEADVAAHKSTFLYKSKPFYAVGSPIEYNKIAKVGKKEKQTHTFVYTGRLDAWKNIDLLIRTFTKYHEMDEKSELYVVGDGPEFAALSKEVAQSKANEYIHLTGRQNQENLIGYLAKGDVFVFPSKGEGVSLSILEALAAGLPVVGFDVTGVRDLVIPGRTGILVKQMDEDAFIRGMQDAVLCKDKLSSNCKAFAAQFDASEIARKIFQIIEEEYRRYTHEAWNREDYTT